jgi:hypothetical protein
VKTTARKKVHHFRGELKEWKKREKRVNSEKRKRVKREEKESEKRKEKERRRREGEREWKERKKGGREWKERREGERGVERGSGVLGCQSHVV